MMPMPQELLASIQAQLIGGSQHIKSNIPPLRGTGMRNERGTQTPPAEPGYTTPSIGYAPDPYTIARAQRRQGVRIRRRRRANGEETEEQAEETGPPMPVEAPQQPAPTFPPTLPGLPPLPRLPPLPFFQR